MYIDVSHPTIIANKKEQRKHDRHMKKHANWLINLIAYVLKKYPHHLDWVLENTLSEYRYKRHGLKNFELFLQFEKAKRGQGLKLVFSELPKEIMRQLP